jgi:hypothetical protein
MDIREQRQLEEQRSRALRKINNHLDKLDYLYNQVVRDKNNLSQQLFNHYHGEQQDLTRMLGKIEQNVLDFERLTRRKQYYFEEEKRKISREFEKRMR